jgi:hypothetical protein
VGVFRDSAQPDRVAAFSAWLGCRVSVVVDFPARGTWEQVAAPEYLLRAWSGQPVDLVASVPLLPSDELATVAEVAAGVHDDPFRAFGQAAVAAGRPDLVVRLGWEFNLEGSRWFTDDPALFVAAWRRVVGAMRSVEGQRFRFLWNPGRSGVDALPAYPGDDVVDLIGLDVYDATGAPGTYPYPEDCDEVCRAARQRTAWEQELFGGPSGLARYAAFARARGKPFTVPEWGLWDRPDGTGGGDNPDFIRRMHAFLTDPAQAVAFHAYFEFDGSDGRHSLMEAFPVSGAVFRELFGPAAGAPELPSADVGPLEEPATRL